MIIPTSKTTASSSPYSPREGYSKMPPAASSTSNLVADDHSHHIHLSSTGDSDFSRQQHSPNGTGEKTMPSNIYPWQPGFARRIPWAGISCLFGVFCAGVVEIAILIASNGKPITSWKYPPSLYLSMAYTIGNILLAAGFSQGLTIYWWRQALKEGTQLGDLHRIWDHGMSPVAALFAGRHFNYISFAALFLAITPINGPLLQRASSITTERKQFLSEEVTARIPAVTSLQNPTGWTSGRSYGVTTLDAKFTPVVYDWNTGANIMANGTGCASDGICNGQLEAAGLAISCNASTADFDISSFDSDGQMRNASFEGIDLFQLTLGWSARTEASNMTLDVQWKPGDECQKGKLEVRNCTIGAATVRYPVTIDGNKSTIALQENSKYTDDTILSLTDLPAENMYGIPSPFGGYAYALSSKFNSKTHISFSGAAGYTMVSDGSLAAQFMDMSSVKDYTQGICNTKFSDPTPYIFQQARDLMFRTALSQGNATTMQNLQNPTELRTVTVYHSHYEYLAGAIALTFLAMALVMATFNGFWLLGRNVTMSPIETAKAFNAPLLAHEHPNAEVQELVKGAGAKPVRYGEVMTQVDEDRMRDDGNSMYKGVEANNRSTENIIELRNSVYGFEDPSRVQPLSGKRRGGGGAAGGLS
ncbi:hypothetical protein CKM354_001255500 [Cercospora kikuchii]|uniref:Uncharacterized protein n=1 Tax=Cercospora kikuchii TaxID=84275 RepID=A0A9P3L1V1_9PEZI|nr:uncharacterized protein CKM354_001255500 [Cercospora kikuchii]GIZ49525.1 hypothetical protein CKM354_001255500 [Cercospora kikuchii]